MVGSPIDEGLIIEFASHFSTDTASTTDGASSLTDRTTEPFLADTTLKDVARVEDHEVVGRHRAANPLRRSISESAVPRQTDDEKSELNPPLAVYCFQDDTRETDKGQHQMRASLQPRRPGSPLRTKSELDLHGQYTTSCKQPLKSCIKKKAKTTTPTPTSEQQADSDNTEERTLRRVKTVDFDEDGSKAMFALPCLIDTPCIAFDDTAFSITPLSGQVITPRKLSRRAPPCPNTLSGMKSSPADTAITRTDVHVIAITPSSAIRGLADAEESDPAKPIMQIVESQSGRYEVIWGDVLPEHSDRRRCQRSTSANYAPDSISSNAIYGLERVNTKLADWYGTWNSPSDSVQPTIVVFPDDDSQPHQDYAMLNNEELAVPAPPNSKRTSAAPSRLPSRPVSAPLTRAVSQENIATEVLPQDQPRPSTGIGWVPFLEHTFVVPDSERQSNRPFGMRRRKQPQDIRKLSNVEEAELRFRGHRDSVTIAHSRLVYPGGLSPELFAHRDSVSMARKRMHARKHITSAARPTLEFERAACEYRRPVSDDDVLEASSTTVQEHATQGYDKKIPNSMLVQQQRMSQGHIQIAE